MALSRRTWLALAFFAMAIVLYVYGVASASRIPFELESVALPLDFMVGMPLAFYLMVIRPCGLSPLYAIPVIWLGYGLSATALGSPNVGILPVLLAILVPAELAIVTKEVRRIARAFKEAKPQSADPLDWLYAATHYLVRKELPARMMAAELGVWYYALFSWRKRPIAKPKEKLYSYHNAGGYMNLMLGLALAFPVEMIGMHLLLSQWSAVAAAVATLFSAYAGIWLLGDARARIMRPVVMGENVLRINCGIQLSADVSMGEIESIGSKQPIGIGKSDTLNCGTFYQANIWIVTKSPVEVRTLLGKKRVRALGLSLDDPIAFMRDCKREP